jgi:hypothetical protein
MGDERNAGRIFAGNPEGNRPLGRLRRRWMDIIKRDLRYDGVVLTGLIWLRIGTSGKSLTRTAVSLRVAYTACSYLEVRNVRQKIVPIVTAATCSVLLVLYFALLLYYDLSIPVPTS